MPKFRALRSRNLLLATAAVAFALHANVADTSLERGIKLYEEGRTKDAIEPLRQAVKAAPASTPAQAYLGLSFAEAGFCKDALPLLKKSVSSVSNQKMKRAMGEDGVRCAMTLNAQDQALEFLRVLRRDYPADPEILYLATHVFSDLSVRTSEELIYKAPESYQVHQLNAEALETQGKWQEAEYEYRQVLAKNPKLMGIHMRLARLILSRPKTASTFTDAKVEIEAELKLDPNNPAAEYVLGEMARESDDWPTALEHFEKATSMDAHFADAFIGLGRSLIQVGKPEAAIEPLQKAVRLEPQNPTAHYHLSIALRHAGHITEANQEAEIFKTVSAQVEAERRQVGNGVLGRQGIDSAEK